MKKLLLILVLISAPAICADKIDPAEVVRLAEALVTGPNHLSPKKAFETAREFYEIKSGLGLRPDHGNIDGLALQIYMRAIDGMGPVTSIPYETGAHTAFDAAEAFRKEQLRRSKR